MRLTWKDIVTKFRDGIGLASLTSFVVAYLEGIALKAARQRREKGTFCSKSDL